MITDSIAVICTILNEKESIIELLNSFLSQTKKPDEIIIVDGGSDDGTLEILNQYANRDQSIRYIVETGVNIAQGRNLAIANAKSGIIAVTDGGCRPEATWLEELVKPLLGDSSYGAVSGARKVDYSNNFEYFAGYFTTSGISENEKDRMFYGRNSAFRKNLWEAVGGYPEWLYTAEDTLFALRAKSLGFKVAAAPNAIVSWRPRPSFKKLAKQYYLYGKGTGRIGQADTKAALYHIRNHSLWIFSFLAGPLFNWFWLITIATLIFIFTTLVSPLLKKINTQQEAKEKLSILYVPLIIMTRSFFNNLGQLYGAYEYNNKKLFKNNHKLYTTGKWKSAYIN